MQTFKGRLASLLLGAAALLCALAALFSLRGAAAAPVLAGDPGSAADCAALFLDCLAAGDYAAASEYCSVPLPAEAVPEDEAQAVYEALQDSFRWEWAGETKESGLRAQATVMLHHLDLPALTAGLKDDVHANLERFVDEAEHSTDIYNSDGSYRDEVVLRAWDEALAARLAQKDTYMTKTFLPLALTAESGSWKVIADETLLRTLSGGIG